jgi:uncharacterized membrane protein YphA (DoxX/SURF4 family)
MKQTDYKKIAVEFCRFLLGLVFIFSGFVKAVDPLGTTYKNLDYLSAFGLNVFDFLAMPLAFAQIAVEFAMGVCLIAGVYRKFHAVLFLAFMCFMTPLTFYLALKNPVTDCGCFGDALILTNWETFSKNIVLLAAAVVVFLWYKKMTPLYIVPKSSSCVTAFTYIFIVGVSLYCYTYLPLLDFRPYKVGADIPELMAVPENAQLDEYETKYIYSKDGIETAFTLEDYPKNDSTWTFVDSKSKLIKKGYESPIHDFIIENEDGEDITGDILNNDSYTFLLIAHKLEKASDSNIDKINEIFDFCIQQGYSFYCLTASLPADIKEWKENTGAEYPFYTMDDIPLKTIIRSNPGLLLIKSGIIQNKWSNPRIPGEEALAQPLEETEWGQIPANQAKRNIALLALSFLSALALLFWLDWRSQSNQKVSKVPNVPKTKNTNIKQNKILKEK